MKKRVVLVLVLLVIAAIGAIVVLRNIRREPSDRILISGNIELTEINIGFKTSGKLVELNVKEGDPVTKGMVVARLDQDQLLRQRDREQAVLAAAQGQVAQAETAVRWQRQTLEADIEQRRADLRAAEARLEELKAGSRPQEIQEAAAGVEAAQAEASRAKRDWERAQVLYKNDDISTSQYDQFRSRFEAAEAALKQTRQRSGLVEAGPRQETIAAAAAQVERARAALKAAEANQLETERRQQEVVTRRAEIERSRAQIALIDSQLADTVAVAPVSGVVLSKSADVGEILAPGTTIVTIGDIDQPWLRGYINETELGHVKLGSKARVTTDSFSGKVYWGSVTFISSQAEFTPKQIQTRQERVKLVYRIKIDVDNPQHELKSNMPADAEVMLEK